MVNIGLTNDAGAPVLRRDDSARRALLLRRKQRIENQLGALDARTREAKRKRETRLKVVVGAAVLAHAKLDPDFAVKLHEVLARAVTRPGDRSVIADQLQLG